MLQLNDLCQRFGRIDFREKRPGLYKVLVPFFHEDGDMYDIFVEEVPSNSEKLRISDYGLTLMKLSYTFDIDTENKQQVLESIIRQNRCDLDNGSIFLVITPNQFEAGLNQMIQVISKVSNMDIISREVIRSYFYEMLDSFVKEAFKDFHIQKDFTPLPDSDLKVDYLLPNSTKKPIYLFGVNDNAKASRVVISCLQFNNNGLPYNSLIIHEDFNSLSTFNKNQITNVVDKQFTSLNDFRGMGINYVNRMLTA